MEDIAVDAKVNLQKQSEELHGIHESIHDFDTDLKETSSMLEQIQRNRIYKKVCFASLGTIVLIAVIIAAFN
jgi:uncharacterized membrane protein YjjP (DUF1212 family)